MLTYGHAGYDASVASRSTRHSVCTVGEDAGVQWALDGWPHTCRRKARRRLSLFDWM